MMNPIGLQIKHFKGCYVEHNNLNFKDVNTASVLIGYAVPVELCSSDVLEWVKSNLINYNKTFYKSWSDVVDKNRFDLFIDQLVHYITSPTDSVYIPNTNPELIRFKDLTVIKYLTKESVINKCYTLLGGIALKQTTIEDIFTILNHLGDPIDIKRIKNREAVIIAHIKLGTYPIKPEDMVRFLLYKATTISNVIKSKEVLRKIKFSNYNIVDDINNLGIDKIASVYNRYKPIFLAFRNYKNNRGIINRVSKLSKIHHKPKKVGFWESILSDSSLLPLLPEKLNFISNYKKVSLLETILVRGKKLGYNVYVIRNQKMFIKELSDINNKSYYTIIYDMIYKSLLESLSTKKCKIKLDKSINLTVPKSEKSFIGDIPLGSWIDLTHSDTIIGIYWREEDGLVDLDLSAIDNNGDKIGWDRSYYNEGKSVIFSGDMTRAIPEATELMYASEGFPPMILKVNLFNGVENNKFRFFIANEIINNMERNYMVDPNNIIYETDLLIPSLEVTLGVITENRFYFANLRTGNQQVSKFNITNKYTNYVIDTADCFLQLQNVLIDAGFEINDEEFDIDLSVMDKSTLIGLLS